MSNVEGSSYQNIPFQVEAFAWFTNTNREYGHPLSSGSVTISRGNESKTSQNYYHWYECLKKEYTEEL